MKRSSSNCRDTKKIRKIINEEVRLGINESDSDTDEIYLKKDLFPLSHYMNDREEMIEQMFSIIKGEKLQKMLPPILKDMPLNELKADCLIHLLGMSTTRISAILEGREINSSSDSETHSDSSISPSTKTKKKFIPLPIKQEGCSDISDNSEEVVLIDPDIEDSIKAVGSKKKKHSDEENGKRKKKHRKKKNEGKITKNMNKSRKLDDIASGKLNKSEHLEEKSSDSDKEALEESPKEGKTLLEILELEMRARAIRALLHKGVNSDITTAASQNQSVQGDVSSENTNLESNQLENINNIVTPAKNFRTNKDESKNDDVIVVAPELETIDLTDENIAAIGDKQESEQNILEAENIVNSIQLNVVEEGENLNSPNNVETRSSEEGEISSSETEGEVTEVIAITDSPEHGTTQDNIESSKKVEEGGQVEQQTNSWAQRWLDSKEVKKVVTTSKICGSIRKKIKKAKLAKQIQEEPLKSVPVSPQIEGRVDEYKSLPKSINTLSSSSEAAIKTSAKEDKKDQAQENNDNCVEVCVKDQNVETAHEDVGLLTEQVQDISSTKIEEFSQQSQVQTDTSSFNESVKSLEENDEVYSMIKTKGLQESSSLCSTSQVHERKNDTLKSSNDVHSFTDNNKDGEIVTEISKISDSKSVHSEINTDCTVEASEMSNVTYITYRPKSSGHIIKASKVIYLQSKSNIDQEKPNDHLLEANLLGVLKPMNNLQANTYHVGEEYEVSNLVSGNCKSDHIGNICTIGLEKNIYENSEYDEQNNISEGCENIELKSESLKDQVISETSEDSTFISCGPGYNTTIGSVICESADDQPQEELKDAEIDGSEKFDQTTLQLNVFHEEEIVFKESTNCESNNKNRPSTVTMGSDKVDSCAKNSLLEDSERQSLSNSLSGESSCDKKVFNIMSMDELTIKATVDTTKTVLTKRLSSIENEPETLEINITDEDLDIE